MKISQPVTSTVTPTVESGHVSSVFNIPSPSLSSSQTSPIPSPSKSAWSALAVFGQLSFLSITPSLSESGHPFVSTAPAVSGQLSSEFITPSPSLSSSQTSPIPSPSKSAWSILAVLTQLSLESIIPSLSISSHTSPSPSASASSWPGFGI